MSDTITGHVHHTVVLGSRKYTDTVTITGTGDVRILAAGATGVYLGAVSGPGSLTNQGTITAGAGAYGLAQGGAGGIGVDFASLGQVSNSGTISGGAGSNSGTAGAGGAGGAGIILAAGGTVSNAGTIWGGRGGTGSIYGHAGPGGAGGIGIDLAAGGTLVNSGIIKAGATAYSYVVGASAAGVYAKDGSVSNAGTILGGQSDYYGTGGAGLTLSGGHATNTGLIGGGYGKSGYYLGSAGGVGVNLLAGATLQNSGSIVGGTAARFSFGSGVYLAGDSTFVNSGIVNGGSPGTNGAPGAGVLITGASHVSNSGTILGDTTSYGAMVESGSLSNAGTVVGGSGYSYYTQGRFYSSNGATGVALVSNAATVSDSGVILGGAGGTDDYPNSATAGGIGVSLSGGKLMVSRDGTVVGGAGGYAGYAYVRNINGGAGVSIQSGGKVFNAGSIAGGQGGATKYYVGGNGGVGVYLNGGILTTSGTITGAAGGIGLQENGMMGAAIQFGTLGGTLVVDPGAVFHGDIVASAAAGDTLVLAGTSAGALSGFGTSITGFATIAEDAHAHWTLAGSISGTGSVDIGTGAALTLNGAVSIGSIAFAAGGGETLRLAVPREVTSTFHGFAAGDTIDLEGLLATSLHYGGGTLTLSDNGAVVDTLRFAGALSGADFGLKSDGHGGTNVVFETNPFGNVRDIAFVDAASERPNEEGLFLHSGSSSHPL